MCILQRGKRAFYFKRSCTHPLKVEIRMEGDILSSSDDKNYIYIYINIMLQKGY